MSNYPQGPPPPRCLPALQRKQKKSSIWCLRHDRTQSKHVPTRDRAFAARIKAQLEASSANVARLEALASGFRQLTPASPQSISDLAATFNRRA
jgi:hypothetical protein